MRTMHSPQQAEFFAKIRRTIERYGQQIMGITEFAVPFSYTIGNAQHGLPELLIFGPIEVNQAILNRLGERQRGARAAVPSGTKISFGGKHPLRVIDATSEVKQLYTVQVGQYYGHENYRIQQVLVPDPNGVFPGEPGCLKPYDLPVFSARKLIT